MDVAVSPLAAVTVVLASKGYPDSTEVGVALRGLEEAESEDTVVFHAGTARRDDALLSAGGRVLDVTALGATLAEARERAYRGIGHIDFPGMQCRSDIALKAAGVPA
jgi:phosphoribosylamine--glycine ligase